MKNVNKYIAVLFLVFNAAFSQNFTMTPSAITINCGSTTSYTFWCKNVNNSANTTYQWNVPAGWKDIFNNTVSGTITGTNMLTLIPTIFPPNNITVIPKVNNVNQTQVSTNITTPAFTTSATITGTINSSCTLPSSSTFSISAGEGNTVSWNLSNYNIASITSQSNTQATISVTGNGAFVLSAIITNSCGQTATVNRTISAAAPGFISFTYGTAYSSQSLCIASEYDYEYSIPELNFTDKIIANFAGMTPTEAALNSNWEWRTLNSNVILSGSKGTRNICTMAAGQTGVGVRAKTACGWSDWVDITFEITPE
jgi:hypothetical protein